MTTARRALNSGGGKGGGGGSSSSSATVWDIVATSSAGAVYAFSSIATGGVVTTVVATQFGVASAAVLRLASISTVHPTFLLSRCRRPWWRGSRAARLHPRREVTKRPRSGLSRVPLDRRVPEGRQTRSSAQPAASAKLAVRPPCPARARHVRIALVRAASLKHALCALREHTAAAGRLVPSRASAGRRGAHALRGRAPLMAACPRLPVTTLWRALGTWRWRVPWGTQARRAGLASPRAAARAQPHPATFVGWHQRLAAASFALSAHFVWAELRLISSVDARSTRTAPPVPQMTGPARRALRVFRVPAVPQRLSSPRVPPPSR
jgi:hypothetical protein